MHAFWLIGHNRALIFRKALLINLKKQISKTYTEGGQLTVKRLAVETETPWSVDSEMGGQLTVKRLVS